MVASSVHADGTRDAEAKALFQAGREAFDGGRYDAALSRWQEAYDLSGRPTLFYNLGLAHDRLRHDDKALWAFRAYLSQVPESDNRMEVEGRIHALEAAKSERESSVVTQQPVLASTPVVPTPEETARKTQSHVTEPITEPINFKDGKPITSRWWFWTGIGAVVVTGVVVAIAASSGGVSKSSPLDSRTGVEIMTLSRAE